MTYYEKYKIYKNKYKKYLQLSGSISEYGDYGKVIHGFLDHRSSRAVSTTSQEHHLREVTSDEKCQKKNINWVGYHEGCTNPQPPYYDKIDGVEHKIKCCDHSGKWIEIQKPFSVITSQQVVDWMLWRGVILDDLEEREALAEFGASLRTLERFYLEEKFYKSEFLDENNPQMINLTDLIKRFSDIYHRQDERWILLERVTKEFNIPDEPIILKPIDSNSIPVPIWQAAGGEWGRVVSKINYIAKSNDGDMSGTGFWGKSIWILHLLVLFPPYRGIEHWQNISGYINNNPVTINFFENDNNLDLNNLEELYTFLDDNFSDDQIGVLAEDFYHF